MAHCKTQPQRDFSIQTLGDHKLLFAPHPNIPLVRFEIVWAQGSSADPKGASGATSHLFELMFRGTQTHTRRDFSRALEHMGSSVGAHVGHMHASIRGIALARHFEQTFHLISQAIHTPALEEKELAEQRSETREALQAEREDDDAVLQIFTRKALFQGHPLGRAVDGEEADLNNIDRCLVLSMHNKILALGPKLLAFSGPQDHPDLASDWAPKAAHDFLISKPSASTETETKTASKPLKLNPPQDRLAPAIHIVEKPECAQVQMHVGTLGPAASPKDRLALWLGIQAYGGTFTSPLTQDIRVRRGWSYTASASTGLQGQRPNPILLYAAPEQKNAVACFERLVYHYGQLQQGDLSYASIDSVRAFLNKRYPLDIGHPADALASMVDDCLEDNPASSTYGFLADLKAISNAQVIKALRAHLGCRPWLAVVVGAQARSSKEMQRAFSSKDRPTFWHHFRDAHASQSL